MPGRNRVHARLGIFGFLGLILVPRRGLEPPHPCEYQHLKLARLPIPPPGPVSWRGLIGPARAPVNG